MGSLLLVVAVLLIVAALAGYTASIACLVLERRLSGMRPTGRSRCVCGTPIPLYRNIPVVSWLAQRGRAKCCGAHIPTWYLGSEAGTVLAAFAGVVAVRGHRWAGALAGIALAMVVMWLWHRRRFGL